MQQKLKTYLQQFRDVRAIGLAVFGVMVLLVSWSGVKVIQSNYDLQKQISRLNQENAVQELVNDNLTLRNQYLKTDQYLELAARRQFGRGSAGETLVMVPKAVALAHAPELTPAAPGPKSSDDNHKPTYQKNFEAWMDFFFNRGQTVEQ